MVTFGISTGVRDIADSITTATAKLSGIISSAVVLVAGTGYTDGETVDIVGVTSGATGATATVVAVSGPVTAITIVLGSSGYTDGETLTLTGQTSSQADATGTATTTNDEWFAEDITIDLSGSLRIAPIVVDFSYDVSSIIQYTLNSGTTWNSFNNGSAIDGGQSLFIRVLDGSTVNFRALTSGNINRVVVSVP